MATVGGWLQASIVKIDVFLNEENLGPATGFIVDRDNKLYLVSAWHVFSGRNFKTGQCIDKNGPEPNRFDVTFNAFARITPETERDAPLEPFTQSISLESDS